MSPLPHLASTTVYDYDSLTWCIQHALVRPKWQNIFTIMHEIDVVYWGFAAYYLLVILFYFQTMYENVTYDAYTCMLKVLQILVYMPPHVRLEQTSTRILVLLPIWGLLIFYLHVISFYILIMHKSIPLYQIHTQAELIENHFQLSGDVSTRIFIRQSQLVS